MSEEQKKIIQRFLENYIFMKNWPLANCTFILNSREETGWGLLYTIPVTTRVAMHSPAVNRADEVFWLCKWTDLAWAETFAQDQDREGKVKGNAMAKNLGIPSQGLEAPAGHLELSWGEWRTGVCRVVFLFCHLYGQLLLKLGNYRL